MPMTGASIGTALAALAPFFEFFRPTRSPYLLVVLFSVIGLLVLNVLFDSKVDNDVADFREFWYALAAPVFLVIILLTLFVFLHRDKSGESEDERDLADQHLKFSRAICISTAVICLVAGCWYSLKQDANVAFVAQYVACMCQIVVFTIYAAARLRRREPIGQLNHFQVALVTSLYLLAASACLAFAASKYGLSCGGVSTSMFEECVGEEYFVEDEEGFEVSVSSERPVANFYMISYFVFLILWVSCQYYWIVRLKKMIQISIKDES